MDKRRKNDLSTPAPERGRAYEETEGRKKTKKTKSAELDFLSEGTDGQDKQLQDLPVKEADHSEGNLKAKIRPGAKRTKKPPKSLENFICRPSVRVFQRPDSVGQGVCKRRDGISAKTRLYSQLCHPAQKKCNTDSVVTKDNSVMTNTDPSALSLSSHVASGITSPASDSPSRRSSKKVLPKQPKKTDFKSDITLQETPQSLNKLSVSHKTSHNTQIKPTYPSKNSPDSNSTSQQDSNPQECINVLNEDKTQQGQASPNSSYGGSSGASLHTVPSKPTSCFQKNSSKCSETNSQLASQCSLRLNPKTDESRVDDPNHADIEGVTNEKNKHENSSTQESRPCTNDLSEHPTSDSPCSRKCTDTTSDPSENSRGSKGQNEVNKDLNWTSDVTMKSPQNPAFEHKHYGSTSGSANKEHGRQVKFCTNQEQIEVHHLTDTNNSMGSTSNPQVSPAPVKTLTDDLSSNSKQDRKMSKKQPVRILRSNRFASTASEINHCPVPHGVLQNEAQFNSASESLSSPQHEHEQSSDEQPSKSKPSQNSKNRYSEVSSMNNPPSRKRGRPKTNRSAVQFQANSSQVSVVNPPNDQNTEDIEPERDPKQTRPMARKRGRPKQSFSIQAQERLPELISKKQDPGDMHIAPKDKARNIQKCKKSKRVIMKTIIGKINKMKVKRKDQVLTQILLGQKHCDGREMSHEGAERDACSPDSTATHSLSSLVSSFGGKLGSQINVSKRGTIYMGKRRGRKPKCHTSANVPSQKSPQAFPDNPPTSSFGQPPSGSQSVPASGSSSTLKNIASSSSSGRSSQMHFNAPKIKATSFKQLSETSQAQCEITLTCNSGEAVNDGTASDKGERNNRLDEGVGFCSAPATGSVFTTSGVPGSNSFHGRAKTFSSLPSERFFSPHLPLGSGRPQDSSPSLAFTDPEAHKFKCHRKGHHCLSREKLRRHKYKCKKKYMQLRAKCQDPDFLADIDDLVVRLSKIRIVQRITRTKLGDDVNASGRKPVKGKCQSYDLPCREKVHPPAMFQINLSGYYSPHSALSCEPLHYVRMANMRRKHGCSSEPSEQIVTHFPMMHKLGYPYPGGGFIHPSYKVPFTTTSLGFGLCRGYPSGTTLYPLPFPPSYLHHYPKNPIISPSKFHKKRTKFPRQDAAVWGQNTLGAYPRMSPHSSCDCFNAESGQRQKQKEKGKGRRDKHSMLAERQHGNDACFRLNNFPKDNESSGSRSFNSPSPSSVFSQGQQKDKTFPFTCLNTSNLAHGGEARWSDHQPPFGLGNRNLNQPSETLEMNSAGYENTSKGPETGRNPVSAHQLHRRTQAFIKRPTLIGRTPSHKRITKSRRTEDVPGLSDVLKEQAKTSMQELSSGDKRTPGMDQAGGLSRKHRCSDSSSSREREKVVSREPRSFKAKRRPLIKNKSNHVGQTSPPLRDEHAQPAARNTPSTSASKQQVQQFKAVKHQDVSDGNVVKRRGPGRPRKSPKPSSPPSLLPDPELASSLTIEKTGEDDKDSGDTVLEVIELVIHGEQRSGKKRKIAESVEDGVQNQNEERDVTEASSTHCHVCSTPIGLSPSHVEDSQSEQATASLPNKKYLWAGLYSDVFKTEDVPSQPHQLNTEDLEYNPEEHEYGLLPAPLHVGKYLRVKRINFQLPYDIHWQCARNKVFEKPVTLPQASPSNSSCNPPNSSVAPSCSDDCLDTTLSDDESCPDESCETGSHTHVCEEHHQCHHHLGQQEENSDTENFSSTLSSEERTFVMKHGVFLVRNYEKMKARQAYLLREGARQQEREKEEDKVSSQSEGRDLGEDPTIKSDRCPIERRSCSEEGVHVTFKSRNLSETLQEIWDRIVSCKGSSGQTLSDPLLNLCSRKRSDSALVDLSTVQKQLQSGHYESLAAFHSDMLTVFHCAEKYYGSESAVGRDVSQLRAVYHRAHQEAAAHISSFL